jgi:hypothetical protein
LNNKFCIIHKNHMGIKNLNTYLTKKCSTNSIFKTSIKTISGKTIAIDISIYLYKYLNRNSLLENIYFMIHIFNYFISA